MSDAIRSLESGSSATDSLALQRLWRSIWTNGLFAALSWVAAALVTIGLPDVVPWGSGGLFAAITGGAAIVFGALSLGVHRLGRAGSRLVYYGPWFVAIGLWFALWELTTAKFGWLPKPFFSPPHGLLNVYVTKGTSLLL